MDRVEMKDCGFEMDGNMWCCMLPGHVCISQDPVGFGNTQEEAFEDLMENMDK